MYKYLNMKSLVFFSLGLINFSLVYAEYPHLRPMRTANHQSTRSQQPSKNATGREEIAYADESEKNDKYYRHPPGKQIKADWDDKELWIKDREDFYQGYSQPEAYRRHNPYGPAGIGYDADEGYLKTQDYMNQIAHQQKNAHNHNQQPFNTQK